MAIDIERIAASALDAFLEDQGDERGASARETRGNRRLGPAAAVALGVGLTVAARVAYRRVRGLDLERVGAAVEERLRS